ncbi:MAG TPA: protein kinase [Terriglobales bacterium]|jgi:serine/threonine protein kinase|nr:protein kinase [Terriglobales bacterium]
MKRLESLGLVTSRMIGQTISHYRIVEKLGGGGMGVVYKAEDMRLHRFVALKLLPDDVAHDPQTISRFRREAEAASSLSHPNICTIYDVGEQDGQCFIAMELLEGRTLETVIGGRPLAIETFLGLALPIVDALEAMHNSAIVHRDLKPSNIFVTSRGDAKLLDFGLAKRLRLQSGTANDATTFSGSITARGQLLGTIAYMSPEQAQDNDIDGRSDIFSFGAVLYEMATGRRAFVGESAASVIAEILRGQPKSAQVINPALPAELERIIEKTLEKDPGDRYQSVNDLRVDLRRLQRREMRPSSAEGKTPSSPSGSGRLRPRSPWTLAIAAFFLLLVISFLAVIVTTPSRTSGVLNSAQITFSPELKDGPLVTDGTRLYFHSQGIPVEMSVKGGPIAPLRASASGMQMLDISPDASEMLALKPDLNDEVGQGSIWTVPVLGGYPRRLGNQIAQDAHWSPDGRSIVYANMNSIYVSDTQGANLRQIWEAPAHVATPYFSPDSHRIRVTVDGVKQDTSPNIWELNVDGSNPHRLALDWPEDADQTHGQWTRDGKHFIFVSSREGRNNLYELTQPSWFEFWKKTTAVRLTAGQIDVLGATPSRDNDGLFIIGRIAQGTMQVYDPKLKRFVPFLDGLAAADFVISPDKQWMAYRDYPQSHLWRSRLDGSEKLQLTDSVAWMPQWSPDSKWIAFSDIKEIYRVSIDGGTPEKLTAEGRTELAPNWWPDGKSIAFNDYPLPGQVRGIKVLDMATRKVSIMPGSEGFYVPSWSPDGKYMVAIAENPSRMVVYTAESGTWKDLKIFKAPWQYWVWANDSKSVYLAVRSTGADGESGMYRLTIEDGKWDQVAKFDGMTLNLDGWEGFPSITLDGGLAMMRDTSVVQIYWAKWASGARLE